MFMTSTTLLYSDPRSHVFSLVRRLTCERAGEAFGAISCGASAVAENSQTHSPTSIHLSDSRAQPTQPTNHIPLVRLFAHEACTHHTHIHTRIHAHTHRDMHAAEVEEIRDVMSYPAFILSRCFGRVTQSTKTSK
jgi:hypothetical protein